MLAFIPVCFVAVMLASLTATAATLTGTVVDAAGKPLEGARVDHTGEIVAVALAIPPSANEIRTDAAGHFRVVTDAPAVVIRKPGYASQRVRIAGDGQVDVTLKPMKEAALCKVSPAPKVKTKQVNDVDYTATLYYIETKNGKRGLMSGSGPMYSFGAPGDDRVWKSTEYFEVMYDSGMIDASGHSIDGNYWRTRTIFGAAAQYFDVDRATAELLDCVMDRIMPH